jgi:protein-tyrosine phosphatase
MAQGVLEKKVQEAGLPISVDSCGTAGYHIGEPPDERAIDKAAAYGIDISGYRGRQFTAADFDNFDRIFAMDYSNYENIVSLAQNEAQRKKVNLILNLIYPGENRSVPDPYYGGESGFENVYQLLDKACDELIQELNEKS